MVGWVVEVGGHVGAHVASVMGSRATRANRPVEPGDHLARIQIAASVARSRKKVAKGTLISSPAWSTMPMPPICLGSNKVGPQSATRKECC
jgi:hypothetical protein